MSIQDWQKGCEETEKLLGHLAQEAKNFAPPTTETGQLLFNAWIKDLEDAQNEARQDAEHDEEGPIKRALRLEANKLRAFVSELNEDLPDMDPPERTICRRWRDPFRQEADLCRDLKSTL